MWINELQYTCKIFIRIYPIINNRNIQNRGMSYEKVIYLGITMLSAMVLVGCSNTSSAPNTTSHSSNVKQKLRVVLLAKKRKENYC